MTDTFSEGDLIEATKGENIVRGRLIEDTCAGDLYVHGWCIKPLLRDGYKVTLIEKAAPALPDIPGAYLDKDGDMWLLDRNLNWGDFSLMELPPSDRTRPPHSYAPFTRLEPVADTAKKVLDRIASEVDVISSFDWKFVQLKLAAVATEFGVKFL